MPVEQRIIPEGIEKENVEPTVIYPGQQTSSLVRAVDLFEDHEGEFFVQVYARCEDDDSKGQIAIEIPLSKDNFRLIDVTPEDSMYLDIRNDDGTLSIIEWDHAPALGVKRFYRD